MDDIKNFNWTFSNLNCFCIHIIYFRSRYVNPYIYSMTSMARKLSKLGGLPIISPKFQFSEFRTCDRLPSGRYRFRIRSKRLFLVNRNRMNWNFECRQTQRGTAKRRLKLTNVHFFFLSYQWLILYYNYCCPELSHSDCVTSKRR